MKFKLEHMRNVVLVAGLSLVLAACQQAQAVPIPTATEAPITATRTPEPTATQVPPTATNTAEPTATETAAPTATATPIVVGPTGFPADVNPLTGLQVEDPKILDRRPVMIKVSNFPRIGRPHSGLSFADIVYDYYVGEGTNRFLALFYGQDAAKVGPIRSARLADAQIVNLYKGILGYSGADSFTVQPTILNALGNRAIVQGPNTCPALCDEGAEHTVTSVFADTDLLSQFAVKERNATATDIKASLEGNSFDSHEPEQGQAATGLSVFFNIQNIGEWRYDPATGKYLRWIEEVDTDGNISMIPLLDRETEEQLAFSNVVVMFAPYTEYAPTLHEIGIWFNYDGRRAVLFRDGKAIEGIWKSPSVDRPPVFQNKDGSPLPLKPGNTWIVVAGINSNLQEKTTGQWEMRFFLP